MQKNWLIFLLISCFSFCLINAEGAEFSDQIAASQEQIGDDKCVSAASEEDLFGEPEIDDPTLIPVAPKEVIEVPQPTASQALLQKFGCTLIAGYLVCRKCAGRMWRKLKSVY